MSTNPPLHQPVLLEEVMNIFNPKSGDRLLDTTLGNGGHAKAYLERSAPAGKVVGLDADVDALAQAQAVLAEYKERVTYIHTNFSLLKDSLDGGGILTRESGVPPLFNHVLFDLGIGSHQLADPVRGFSFSSPGTLSMRYGDTPLPPSSLAFLNDLERRLGYAPDVEEMLRYLRPDELQHVLHSFGEERYAKQIANALKASPLPRTARQLAERIQSAVPAAYVHGRIHPATRTFQALRLGVNRELEALRVALPQAIEVVGPGGIVAVISFHSLEDRIVKQFLREAARICKCPAEQPECTCNRTPTVKLLTKRPIVPTEAEIKANPRARSAHLRAAEVLRSP